MDQDDDLIRRLQGLGDKLDERRERSMPSDVDVTARRRRASGPRRFAQAAAVLVVLALAIAAFRAVDGGPDDRVRVAATTTTTSSSFSTAEVERLASDLRERADRAVEECEAADATSTTSSVPALPPESGEFMAVGIGPGCSKGWARTEGMTGDELVPVYRTPEGTEVIGYWLAGAGWVTPEEATAPDFDPALLRAAAELANESSSQPGG